MPNWAPLGDDVPPNDWEPTYSVPDNIRTYWTQREADEELRRKHKARYHIKQFNSNPFTPQEGDFEHV